MRKGFIHNCNANRNYNTKKISPCYHEVKSENTTKLSWELALIAHLRIRIYASELIVSRLTAR